VKSARGGGDYFEKICTCFWDNSAFSTVTLRSRLLEKLQPDDFIGRNHRVDRVISFFSSRPIWDSPTPSHAGECVMCAKEMGCTSLFRSGGGRWVGTLTCGRGDGKSQFRRGDIDCGTLYIYVLCGLNQVEISLQNSHAYFLPLFFDIFIFEEKSFPFICHASRAK
jgi:hypothetical protein